MTDSKYTRDQIMAKVEKLLAVANDPNANENLAAAMAAKAQELMQQWAIEEVELNAAGQQQTVKYVVKAARYLGDKVQPWEDLLAASVARGMFCHPVKNDKKREFYFAGRDLDAEVALYTFEQLRAVLEPMSRREFQKHANEYKRQHYGQSVYKLSNAQAYRGKWLHSWLTGAVNGIWAKMMEQRKTFQASSSTALVVVENRDRESAQFANEHFGGLRESKMTRRTVFGEAADRGFQAGKQLDVRPGLGNEAPKQLK